jgi:hypothetical protein
MPVIMPVSADGVGLARCNGIRLDYVTLRFAGAVDIRFSCSAQSLQDDVNKSW